MAPKRKNKVLYDEKTLKKAVSEIKAGFLSYGNIKYNIPKTTLSDNVTGKRAPGSVARRKPAIRAHIEHDLVEKNNKSCQFRTWKQLQIKAVQIGKKAGPKDRLPW